MESIEVSGKSVEDALQQALTHLGKRPEDVEVIVLQEPAPASFGRSAREARVQVTVRSSGGNQKGAIITPEMADMLLGDDEGLPLPEIYDEEEEDAYAPDTLTTSPYAPTLTIPVSLPQTPLDVDDGGFIEVAQPSREDVEIAVDVLQHILRHLNIRAQIQVRTTDPLTMNIQGIHENLALLIGRKGETLAALQLLVNLIVAHKTKRRFRIIVDAENYRLRREENLRSLAQRVAQQVRSYRRSIALEAMPPHERRIVHLALSEMPDVSTESIGEGDQRRVVISLKRFGR